MKTESRTDRRSSERVKIGKGAVIVGRSVVRGPSIIGEDAQIDSNAYIALQR